jgi:hypothetical protein
MTRKPPIYTEIPNSLPKTQIDVKKREYAHLATNPERRIITMNSKRA